MGARYSTTFKLLVGATVAFALSLTAGLAVASEGLRGPAFEPEYEEVQMEPGWEEKGVTHASPDIELSIDLNQQIKHHLEPIIQNSSRQIPFVRRRPRERCYGHRRHRGRGTFFGLLRLWHPGW